ncbi:hypothetical protein CR513_27342, partial [Mucuna pruriens]
CDEEEKSFSAGPIRWVSVRLAKKMQGEHLHITSFLDDYALRFLNFWEAIQNLELFGQAFKEPIEQAWKLDSVALAKSFGPASKGAHFFKITKYEMFFMNKFPSKVLHNNPLSHISKIDLKAKKCIFLGFRVGVKGYVVYYVHSRQNTCLLVLCPLVTNKWLRLKEKYKALLKSIRFV